LPRYHHHQQQQQQPHLGPGGAWALLVLDGWLPWVA
jgi:hypothetical protein